LHDLKKRDREREREREIERERERERVREREREGGGILEIQDKQAVFTREDGGCTHAPTARGKLSDKRSKDCSRREY
jgi:hypothetical protein